MTTTRNDIPFPDDDVLSDECRESARLISLQFAQTMLHTSDSDIDESFALANLMMLLTRIAYRDDYTTTTLLALESLLPADDLEDFLFVDDRDALPILRYFDIDNDFD